ncbi:MAG TPA: hypothetical protein VHK01_04360, partial [Lacipirellulaceae bacterium]|nr:hypothetical protein [Lacipirellulaceae bacterium]
HGLIPDRRWLLLFSLLLGGCRSSSATIEVPEWDPAAAADRALSDYDTNGDRKLSREELKKCPGLLSAIDQFDQDRDRSISGDELTAKLNEIRQQDAALVEITCVVTRGGRPFEGATVKFVPEPFMGEDVKPATGVTARDGTTFPSIDDQELPEESRGRVRGVPCGVFRVLVTHPTVAVPAKYNTQTELGRIISRRDHEPFTVAF